MVEKTVHLNEVSHFTYPYPFFAILAYVYGRGLERARLNLLLPYLVCVLRKTEAAECRKSDGSVDSCP